RDVSGRHRKANGPAPLLPVARGKRPYHPVAGYAVENRRSHGVTTFTILLRPQSQQRVEGFAPAVRRRSPLPEPDPPLLHQPERQRPQAGARHGEENGVEFREIATSFQILAKVATPYFRTMPFGARWE